ncbi:esterase/lipase family protein [Methylomonas rapida]|uniref:Alpha/beta hydrolase n=1 Tax=Methylomonas rapida TaxID=2963939 RepID=A0ABY7GGB4_9GAMM|nr:alpha/beta hydrolase [Methylomonas rapida]WAR43180.1 alpha/beta hydrolase [Methylomonas rapida]
MTHHFFLFAKPPIPIAFLQLASLALAILLLQGCATPVGINPVDIQTGYQINTVSALSAGEASEASKMVLRRNGLMDRFETEPEAVLAELHAGLKPSGDEDKLFALAELSLLQGERNDDHAYFLAASVYAWSLLFPGNGGVQLKPSDPRYRLAYDLYNQGIAQGLADPEGDDKGEIEVYLRSGEYPLPFGKLTTTIEQSDLTWGGYKLEHFISTASMQVRGLRNRYRTPGLGASLAASITEQKNSKKVVGSDRIGPRIKVPITAILDLGDARRHLTENEFTAHINVYAANQTKEISLDGHPQPIEFDPTAALAHQLQDNPMYTLEIANFFSGGLFSTMVPQDRARDGLFTLRPYRPGKIPVVLVHGTASSPARWAELVNELEGDSNIRENYQIWAFMYDSANPIPYSAGRLRIALQNAIKEFDPEGKDSALQRMVVIGHSQGGLLTKMTVVDTGTRLWDLISDKPFDQISVNPENRQLLRDSLFFTPLPFVKRVVFISTPQHGAMAAAHEWVTGLVARLVKLPATIITGIAQAAASSGDAKLNRLLRRPPTAADNMNPNNPGLKTLASIPVSPAVRAHSIIAVEGDGPIEEGDDGVVAYKSAHIDEAVSEKVIRWGHSCQDQPEAIEEIRRILMEHLGTPDLASM